LSETYLHFKYYGHLELEGFGIIPPRFELRTLQQHIHESTCTLEWHALFIVDVL